MKKLVVGMVILVASLVWADTTSVTNSVHKKSRKEIARELFNKRTGGLVEVPGVKRGKLVFVNAQSAVPNESVEAFASAQAAELKIDIEVVSGAFDLTKPEVKGNASLFVVDDAALPSLLLAPEQRWALVNIAPLKEGNGSKPAFFNARVKKELTRGFAMLCGATSSNYPGSLTGCVTSSAQLDKFPDAVLAVDIPARYPEYLAGYGIKPAQYEVYSKACEQGWAPAPTNDVQKAIWDKVHAVPDEPIKIKFEKKAP